MTKLFCDLKYVVLNVHYTLCVGAMPGDVMVKFGVLTGHVQH